MMETYEYSSSSDMLVIYLICEKNKPLLTKFVTFVSNLSNDCYNYSWITCITYVAISK